MLSSLRCLRVFDLLGVYERYLVCRSQCFQIKVLRWLCKQTGATVSLLPDFAQPYRLLQSELIQDYFWGRANRFLETWSDLLKSYRKRFERWYGELSSVVGFSLGRAPPGMECSGQDYFKWLVGACGNSLKNATRTLTKCLKVSIFGRYQCHLNCHEKRRLGQGPVLEN